MLQLWVQKITETWVHCGKHTARKFKASRNLEDSFTQAQALAAENADLRRSLTERQAQGDDMQRCGPPLQIQNLNAAAMKPTWRMPTGRQAAHSSANQLQSLLRLTLVARGSHHLHCCCGPHYLPSVMLLCIEAVSYGACSVLCEGPCRCASLSPCKGLRPGEAGLPLLGGWATSARGMGYPC